MKILVTGHKGFIASNLIKALDQHTVSLYEWGDPLPTIKGLNWVVHLGAISSTTEKNVEKVMAQNFDSSCNLIEECNYYGVNFQYASSASVYGLNKNFAENDPVDPRSPYAWSKYLFDKYVESKTNNNQYNIIVQGFRYFNVYGPGEDHKGDQASPYHKFEKQAKETGVIKLFEGSDKFLRDFVPVEFVVEVHKKFLNIKESGIWNIGTGKAKSFEQVATEIALKYNAVIEYIPMPENIKLHYQTYTKADITKLKEALWDTNYRRLGGV